MVIMISIIKAFSSILAIVNSVSAASAESFSNAQITQSRPIRNAVMAEDWSIKQDIPHRILKSSKSHSYRSYDSRGYRVKSKSKSSKESKSGYGKGKDSSHSSPSPPSPSYDGGLSPSSPSAYYRPHTQPSSTGNSNDTGPSPTAPSDYTSPPWSSPTLPTYVAPHDGSKAPTPTGSLKADSPNGDKDGSKAPAPTDQVKGDDTSGSKAPAPTDQVKGDNTSGSKAPAPTYKVKGDAPVDKDPPKNGDDGLVPTDKVKDDSPKGTPLGKDQSKNKVEAPAPIDKVKGGAPKSAPLDKNNPKENIPKGNPGKKESMKGKVSALVSNGAVSCPSDAIVNRKEEELIRIRFRYSMTLEDKLVDEARIQPLVEELDKNMLVWLGNQLFDCSTSQRRSLTDQINDNTLDHSEPVLVSLSVQGSDRFIGECNTSGPYGCAEMNGEVIAEVSGPDSDHLQCTILENIEQYMDGFEVGTVNGIKDVTYIAPGSEEAQRCAPGNSFDMPTKRSSPRHQTNLITIICAPVMLLGLSFYVYKAMHRRKLQAKDDISDEKNLNGLMNVDLSCDTESYHSSSECDGM